MRRPRVTPAAYQRVTLLALVALAGIILTGAAVRLTGSGLGCSDWPNCEEGQLVAPLELHPMVEFVNRLITGIVSAGVIAAVLGSRWREPVRRDLVLLSWGLVAGVLGQIVLGRFTVTFDLWPGLVMCHFLLSLVLLTNAIVLHRRAGEEAPPGPSTLDPLVRRLTWVVAGLSTVVVVTGTVVTATGPHGGDEDAPRFGFALENVARIHGSAVVLLVAAVVALGVVAGRRDAPGVQGKAVLLGSVLAAQGAIGYVQYFNDVPAGLVFAHVVGAVATWTCMVLLVLELADRSPVALAESPAGSAPAEPTVPVEPAAR
jgi:cytochrome c oxidase assembly protein subunit 15